MYKPNIRNNLHFKNNSPTPTANPIILTKEAKALKRKEKRKANKEKKRLEKQNQTKPKPVKKSKKPIVLKTKQNQNKANSRPTRFVKIPINQQLSLRDNQVQGIISDVHHHSNDLKVSPVQIAPDHPESFDQLPALTQFSLAMLEPGFTNVPYVESNSLPSKLATSLINGENDTPISALSAARYQVITLCPILSAYGTNSGYGIIQADLTTAFTMTNANGLGLNTVYGSTTYSSRNVLFGTTAEVVIQAPSAMLSGEVFIGSLPISTYLSSTTAGLIKQSVDKISLVERDSFSIKSVVQNRELIHYRQEAGMASPNPGSFGEEWISYAIITPLAVQSFSGAAAAYTITATLHSNQVWWPMADTPSLMGIVQVVPPGTAMSSPKLDQFDKIVATHAANPVPVSESVITQILRSLLSTAMHAVLAPYAGPMNLISSIASNFADPLSDLIEYVQQETDLEFFLKAVNTRWNIQDEYLNEATKRWIDSTTELLKQFQERDQKTRSILQQYSACTSKHVYSRDGVTVKYYDESGKEFSHRDAPRSNSVERSVVSGSSYNNPSGFFLNKIK